jgi:hypothetical protein
MAGEFVAAGGGAREAVMALNRRHPFFLETKLEKLRAAVSPGKTVAAITPLRKSRQGFPRRLMRCVFR